MDLGFCFQDLGDGGDSFIKSFIEPSGHAYQDAMLEDLVSTQHGGSHLGLSEDSGWDASSFLHPSTTPYGTTTAAHHNHNHNHYSHATSSSFAASSPSPASSSPSGRSSPAGSSLMALADYDEGGLLVGGGVHAGAAMGFPPLGLSYFDLQAMGPMDMPMDALGLYGLGGTSSSSFNALVDPLMSAPPPPSAAHHRGGGGGSRHVLNPVKQEHGHHFPYHHHQHHHHQQQQQQQQGALPASAPSKAGAGVPGMWSPDEPVQRKRKLAASRRPTLAAAAAASETTAEASTGREQQKGGGSGSGKAGDLYELPLAVELAGALVGHRGVAVKLEERPEAATNAKQHHQHHQQKQQQQQQQQQQGEPVELVVERQPPVEVRTRTPSENRNFGVTVRITGHHDTPLPIQSVEVRLAYASSPEDVNQQILGGKKTVSLKEDGRATFDNLSMREASTKHGEREFCLEFVPLTKDGQPLGSFGTRTSAFYAYSHMKVLARRKSVKLRTLNKSHGSVHGGDKMHVIGQPFIKGPSLSIIFATPHGDVTALNPEMYSDSVLFFEAPPYPCPAIFSPYNRDPVREVKVMVQVTNDGRTMSNPLEFTYIADKPVHRADF